MKEGLYRINEQFQINPRVIAAPLCLCHGGPADGLFRRVPPGFILVLAWVGDYEMNATAVEPIIKNGLGPIDVIELMKSVGTYAGHYTRLGQHLQFVNEE